MDYSQSVAESIRNRGAAGPTVAAASGNRSELPHSRRVLATVREIGRSLHGGVFPYVYSGGVVAPSGTFVPISLGTEIANEQTASAPRPAATTSRATTRTASSASPIKRSGGPPAYDAELDRAIEAYPNSTIVHGNDGMWLLVESQIVVGNSRAASFLVGFSWRQPMVRSWGFWRSTSTLVDWIGPRHTNYPDGSICAFDPLDKTWQFGDPIVGLLDIYSVWAFRHLHLELVGFWPGPQSSHHAFERRLEFLPCELCSCGSNLRYDSCCHRNDECRNPIADAVNFTLNFAGGHRAPPPAILKTALGQADPPPISELL